MYTQVATKQVINQGTAEYSQAVSMAGSNAAYVEVTVYQKGGGNLSIRLQEGNDLQNWTNVGSALSVSSAPGLEELEVGDIAGAYIRFRYSQASSGTAIVAAGIHTADF